jgi:hypothetical protein
MQKLKFKSQKCKLKFKSKAKKLLTFVRQLADLSEPVLNLIQE